MGEKRFERAPRPSLTSTATPLEHVVFEVVRRESGGGEAVFQQHRGPDGKDVLKLPAAGRGLLYRLPEVLAAATEGEPSVRRRNGEGRGSACQTRLRGHVQRDGRREVASLAQHGGFPAGTDVVIFPDYDQSGMNHVEQSSDKPPEGGNRQQRARGRSRIRDTSEAWPRPYLTG